MMEELSVTTKLDQDTSCPNDEPVRKQPRGSKYGKIPGIELGATFSSRKACAAAGVHCVVFAGIHGSSTTGAYSVCLSGIYEDDIDHGYSFVYTGTGGKADPFSSSSKQVTDQSFWNRSNKSLEMSVVMGRPVRVIRGPNQVSKWAPPAGYRYDGLYQVVKAYYEEGISGHFICRFDFQRLPGQAPLPVKPT